MPAPLAITAKKACASGKPSIATMRTRARTTPVLLEWVARFPLRRGPAKTGIPARQETPVKRASVMGAIPPIVMTATHARQMAATPTRDVHTFLKWRFATTEICVRTMTHAMTMDSVQAHCRPALMGIHVHRTPAFPSQDAAMPPWPVPAKMATLAWNSGARSECPGEGPP